MIELRAFEETDIPRLLGWVPDARFLLQWAGPQYKFPLDSSQLLQTLTTTRGDRPSCVMFKALRKVEGDVVGHIELMKINYDEGTAQLGRVLIGSPQRRGHGLGRAMVESAVSYAFHRLGLNMVTLKVFDFNAQAIACYRRLGFTEYERMPLARTFGEERWTLIMMKLDRTTWAENRRGEEPHPSDAGKPRR